MLESLEIKDIIKNTKTDLIPNQCKNIGEIKKLVRNCPTCNKEICYTRKFKYFLAIKTNKLCQKCACGTFENRLKLSFKLRGIKKSDDFKQNVRTKMKGRIITWGDKIGNSLRGRTVSSEIIQKLVDSHVGMTGKKHSSDTIEKMRNIKIGNKNPRYGKLTTDITKKKQRISAIKYIKLNRGKLKCNIGKNEVKLLNNIEKITNTKIKRGYEIKELGYVVDGYDKKLNIVYEVYEKYHLQKRIKLRDAIREKEIKEYLKCDLKIIWDI